MRKAHSTLVALLILAAIVYFGGPEDLGLLTSTAAEQSATPSTIDKATNTTVEAAFAAHRSNLQIHGQGVVTKVLSDDTQGSRHQRFILRRPSGHTVLIAHNIDLTERLTNLVPI